MFDIGFSEIVVIAVVALIVIGPERLPKAARTMGHLFGRLQRYVNDVKSDINREMELDELRKLQTEVQTAAAGLQVVGGVGRRATWRSGVRDVERDLNAGATAAATPTPKRRALIEPGAAAQRAGRRARRRSAGRAAAPADAARLRQDLDAMSETTPPASEGRRPSSRTWSSCARGSCARSSRSSWCWCACSRGRRRSTRCSRSRCCTRCRRAPR